MNPSCLTKYFSRYITSESGKTASSGGDRHRPLLTVCTLGDRSNSEFIRALRVEVGPIVDLHNTVLSDMVLKVDTPWWLLMYEYETMSKGLLQVIPQLLTEECSADYDGYAFFRRPITPTRTFTYHTRLLRSSVPYDIVSLRPVGGRKYERILNGWVLYDSDRIKSKRRELP